MKCPYCGAEMREGWLESGKPILWVTEPDDGLLVPEREKGEFYVSNGFWTGCFAAASYCDFCKKIVLSVEEEQPQGPFGIWNRKHRTQKETK